MFMLVLRIDLTKREIKNITPQLTVGQRTFLVENYFKTQSVNEVITLFEERFPDRNPPAWNMSEPKSRKFGKKKHGEIGKEYPGCE